MISLKDILKGKIVTLCLGNIDRGDDGVGPHIAGLLKGKVSYEVIDAGVAPENYTGVIKRAKPDTIIIIDAIHFEGRAGEVRIFSGAELCSGKISTHDVSPKLLIEYLASSTDANIYIVGIKPGSNKFGQGLSREVAKTAQSLAKCFTL